MLLEVTKQLTCMKCTCNRFQLQSSQHGNCLNAQGSCHFLFALYYGCHIFVGVRVRTCLVTSSCNAYIFPCRAHAVLSRGCNYYDIVYLGAYEPPEGSHIIVHWGPYH